MPARKKKAAKAAKKTAPRKAAAVDQGEKAIRQRRSDEEKLQLVRQVMESGNQSAEIKKLGIYPNQFYDWKKRYLGGADAAAAPGGRGRTVVEAGRSAADEAKVFIRGKAALLERLRNQRSELDGLIAQLEQ